MKSENKKSEFSRRDFIKLSTAGALGASILGSIPSVLRGMTAGQDNNSKSRVVIVQHSKVVSPAGEVNNNILKEMLETGITKFSGEKTSAAFWKKIFSPEDIIGLKVNGLGLNQVSGTPVTNHFQAVTSSIISSCASAGIRDENFIIWDRSEDDLNRAGFTIQKEKGKTRVLANSAARGTEGGEGFSDKELSVGEKTTKLSRILTDLTTAMIAVPLMKSHGIAGVTGALKNHYGTINNPREFHGNNGTNPGIPEINLLQEIRSKQKLIIMDALLGVFNDGPRWSRDYMWPFGGLLFATDPVAIDTIMHGIINEKRKEEGMPEISESQAKHIKLSADLGIGKSSMNDIEVIKISLC